MMLEFAVLAGQWPRYRAATAKMHTALSMWPPRWISGSTARASLALPALPSSIDATGARETANEGSGSEFSRIQTCWPRKFVATAVKN